MAYILQSFNPRVGLRGLGSIPGGTGSASDPFGGIGGGSESQLRVLLNKGMTFKLVQIQTGLVNREKYVYCLGSDNKFYKFKQPGTGIGHTPSDGATKTWFDTTVQAATPKKASVTSAGPTVVNTTGPVPGARGLVMVTPTRTGTPGIAPGMTVRPGAITDAAGESKGPPWGLIAGGVALFAVGYTVLKKRDRKAGTAVAA